MSQQEFEAYLALLSGLLRLNPTQRQAISQELKDHLEERLAELTAAGVPRRDAVQLALGEFGDAAGLAHQFSHINHLRRKRLAMRFSLVSVAAVALVAFWIGTWQPTPFLSQPAVAQQPETNAAAETPTADKTFSLSEPEDPFAREMLGRLNQKIAFNFQETPLEEVIAKLAAELKLPLHLDRKALEDEGISAQMPITFKLDKVTASVGLKLLLNRRLLDYVVKNKTLLVTTKNLSCFPPFPTTIYPMADLLVENNALQDPAQLITTIQSIIAPDTWTSVGGSADIQYFQGSLVVSQAEQNHQQLEQLLQELRRVWKVAPGKEREAQAAHPLEQALNKLAQFPEETTTPRALAEYLSEQWKFPVLLDKRALEDEAIDTELEISTKLPSVPYREWLQLALKPQLLTTKLIENEVLMITTQTKADDQLNTQVYQVRDLLVPPERVGAEENEYDHASLINLVLSTIQPDSWDTVGGRGAIQPFRDMLVISTGEENQQRIERLFAQLRAVRKLQGKQNPAWDPNQPVVRFYALPSALSIVPFEAVPALQTEEGKEGKEGENTQQEGLAELAKLLPQLVDPDTWQTAGGTGKIYVAPHLSSGVVVVVHTPKVQAKIRNLLNRIDREVEEMFQRSQKTPAIGIGGGIGGGGGFFTGN